jgi:hypothetical protein
MPFLVLLFLVIFGVIVQIVAGTAGLGRLPTREPAVAATPPPAPVAPGVIRSLGAVEHAFAAGDVVQLCRPGALVDPAVIRQQNAHHGGCESEMERLIATKQRLRLSVRSVSQRRDLATAAVATASGATVPVDFIRQGGRWVLSFSNGIDPMPALAGTL